MRIYFRKNIRKIAAGFFLLFILTGIVLYFIPITRYLMIQGYHQAKVITGRKNIAHLLKDPRTDPRIRERLLLIGEIRQFGVSLGLNEGESYKSLYDTRGKPVVWAVSASPKDRLAPLHWKFPIVGKVPYLGFFSKEDALKERQKLINKGYDTLTRPVSAYSTIGILPDPLFSSMLLGSEEYLADTVIHEMAHETVFVPGDIPFNESMANFVGNVGGIEFLKHRYGVDSEQVRSSLEYKQDDAVFSNFMADFYTELDTFYNSQISSEEKIAGREKIYQKFKDKFRDEIRPQLKTKHFDYFMKQKLNNAYILFNRRYRRDYSIFEELYDLQGKDLKKTIAFLKSIKKEKDIPERIHREVERLKGEKHVYNFEGWSWVTVNEENGCFRKSVILIYMGKLI